MHTATAVREPRPRSFAGRLRRRAGVVLAAVVALSGVGVAFAAWTNTGTGPATAKATTVVTSTVTADTGQAADLYPGGPAGTLYFKIDNRNPTAATFTAMTASAITVDAGHSGCTPATYVSVPDKTGLAISVPANTESALQRSIASAITMNGSAPDACQGAVFSVTITLTGSLATS